MYIIYAWLSLTFGSYIPHYVNFRFNNGPVMSSVIACFLGQFGCYNTLHIFCRSLLCDVCRGCVKDYFTEIKELRTVFNFFVCFFLLKLCLPILTTSLQVHFYLINFIKWFYERGRLIDEQTILILISLQHEFSAFKKIRHGLVIFSRTPIKLTLFWRVYILRP